MLTDFISQMDSDMCLHQKRHSSNSLEYHGPNFIKRRTGCNSSGQDVKQSISDSALQTQFLDLRSTTSKHDDVAGTNISKKYTRSPPQHTDTGADLLQSPFYLPMTSSSNLETATKIAGNSTIGIPDFVIQEPLQDFRHSNFNERSNSGSQYVVQHNGSSDDNNENDNTTTMRYIQPKNTSQTLVEKLQEIYKIIVKQETALQESCSQLTSSQTTDSRNLWTTYKLNSSLIDNYITFITTALLPSQSENDLAIGQEIVDIYRIERRLWVYGTITFLDVLKNFSNFMDPEVCSLFISYAFISISQMLDDIPPKCSISWLEKLGDLSRMAIALYPSGFVDWKLSAEHWYREALVYTYGHGKLYYHISTVQQNTLEAFVNLGKSVFCRGTFIPSHQYMQLVIDNIYQRAFAERNNGYPKNSSIVEYLKHTEVMLLPSFLESYELQNVVLNFFEQKFGIISSDDFFDPKSIFIQDNEKLKHYFRNSSLFAESHILQLVGFGNSKTPFAMLFELPKYLKERKERKEKRNPKQQLSIPLINIENPHLDISNFFETIDTTNAPYHFYENISIWTYSLNFVNTVSIRCSAIVLKKFLHGPLLTALSHLLPWIYFLISVGIRVNTFHDSSLREFWCVLIRLVLPWDSLITFLNSLLFYMKDNHVEQLFSVNSFFQKFENMNLYEILQYFCEHEDLPEIWHCWGSLWFDVIYNKSSNYRDLQEIGLKDYKLLDLPIDGISFDMNEETGINFWKRACRVILLFHSLCREFSFGLIVVSQGNKWDDFVFKFQGTGNNLDSELAIAIGTKIRLFERISDFNIVGSDTNVTCMIPYMSMKELQGYKPFQFDHNCFNKNGELITGSIYTRSHLEVKKNLSSDLNEQKMIENRKLIASDMLKYETVVNQEEKLWLSSFLNPALRHSTSTWEGKLPFGDLNCFADTHVTYFVLDATTWLRHFAHVYKLATNNVLKFVICLTTFQELRFLRKSKDESVLEAATRAVITVRQLYYEKKLLALRFTGNVASHLEEHLEIEEQMTWRSHVVEFVIEAIGKAQDKFNQLNLASKEQGHHYIKVDNSSQQFHFVSLVTDDLNIRSKAQLQNIRTFSTRFMFSICNEIGIEKGICIN